MDEAGARVPVERESGRELLRCDVCGGPTFERHCEIICTRCGYKRDCSDP